MSTILSDTDTYNVIYNCGHDMHLYWENGDEIQFPAAFIAGEEIPECQTCGCEPRLEKRP